MFSVGENIVYGAQGVCKITDITEREIAGKIAKYYALRPIYQENNIILVPLNNEALIAKMRKIMSEAEIKELIAAMPDEETIWIEDDVIRRKKYLEILSSGDRMAIVRVIKTLYFRKTDRKSVGKKLHISDEQILKRAETLLHNELALALDIEPEQVIPFLTSQIEIKMK